MHNGTRKKSGFFEGKSDTGWSDNKRAENVFLRKYPFVKLLPAEALTTISAICHFPTSCILSYY